MLTSQLDIQPYFRIPVSHHTSLHPSTQLPIPFLPGWTFTNTTREHTIS